MNNYLGFIVLKQLAFFRDSQHKQVLILTEAVSFCYNIILTNHLLAFIDQACFVKMTGF